MDIRRNGYVQFFSIIALILSAMLFSASCGGNSATTSGDLALDKVTMKGKPPSKPPPEPADPAIVCVSNGVLIVMDADGSNQEKVYNVDYPAGSWSPDGSKLAFRNSTTYLYNSIYTINLDGTGLFEVISYEDIGVRGTAWSPAPVPGRGSRIAYSYGDDANNDIWLISPDGGNPENITNTTNRLEIENHFTWSPDATRGAYTKSFRADPDVPGLVREMWVHDFTTGEATRVDLGGPFSNSDIAIGSLDWARTQDKIAFQALTSEPVGGNIRNAYEI